ncbi:Nitrite reductase (NAD(P)H) large subunit [Carbonactinospora thermoautotrophica]|uniref:Nitrite reductase (NAD(P)H) large subunit n=1 Tax=Carbonactinospora thermoautotrophica TaxID=1469144 RepID=A0A132MN24_9ACTN|nr:Nitrite reductase (NAD(P)H) large subunit [Carbonactinospora thermoautotrophica]
MTAVNRVVVVGYGMAGARLARELRARARDLRIIVFGAERYPAYNRVLLSSVLAGKADEGDIALAEPTSRVELRTGVTVTAIDPADRTVTTDDGTVTRYDALVLATGSRAWIPPVDGLDPAALPEGVAVFRTLEDCRRILRAAEGARRAVVLGGGLLGLEAARGLALRGLRVEVLHAMGHLMERQLDPGASRVLTRTLRGLGVSVRLNALTEAVLCDQGRVRAVRLAGGEVVEADLLVVACGVRPETALAEAAGLKVDRGVVVDDQLRTCDPAIYAIGDCAEHDGTVYGLVAPAWEQARVVADVITGADPRARYAGSRVVTRLKATGVDLAAMGDTQVEEDEEHEVLQFVDPTRGTYKKVVIRDDRLVGAILLGENATVGTVTQLFDRSAPVPVDRRALLFADLRGQAARTVESPVQIPDRTTICQCNSVTKSAITKSWLAGARSVEDVIKETRATTGCGGCRDTVEGIVEWLAASDPQTTGSCS